MFVHPPTEALELHHVLAALADPVRLQIVYELHKFAEGLNCTAAASPFCQVPKSTLSSHFRILRESGLVMTAKRGVENINVLRFNDIEARFPGLLPKVLEYTPSLA